MTEEPLLADTPADRRRWLIVRDSPSRWLLKNVFRLLGHDPEV
jgi:hypothetical protein